LVLFVVPNNFYSQFFFKPEKKGTAQYGIKDSQNKFLGVDQQNVISTVNYCQAQQRFKIEKLMNGKYSIRNFFGKYLVTLTEFFLN
jgi:hypothetical protein